MSKKRASGLTMTAGLAGLILAAAVAAQPIESWPVSATTWTPAIEKGNEEIELITAEALPTEPLPFTGITPCRLVDTRRTDLPAGYGTPQMPAGSARTFIMTGQTHCFVPLTAKAISLNVAVVAPTSAGYFSIFPSGVSTPTVATINFQQGQNIANAAIVPLADNGGATALVAFANAHLVIDVNGYFGGPVQTLAWKGAWSGSSVYDVDDVVSYAGSSWVSRIAGNLGNNPSAGLPAWDLVAQKGAQGPAGTSPWQLNGSFIYYNGGAVGVGTTGSVNSGVKLDVQGGDLELDSGRGIVAEGGARIMFGPNGHGFRFRPGHPDANHAIFEDSQGNAKMVLTNAGAIHFDSQKICTVFTSGWRDTVMVPAFSSAGLCENLRVQYAATNYQMGCMFSSGFSFGTPNGGVPNPNCGW